MNNICASSDVITIFFIKYKTRYMIFNILHHTFSGKSFHIVFYIYPIINEFLKKIYI